MGFAEDIDAILAEAPTERQTLLFSATLPKRILSIADAHLRDPVRIAIGAEAVAPGEAPKVRHTAYVVQRPHKLAALGRVLDLEQPAAALIFCRTRTEVDEVTEALNARGYRAEALHGGMSQDRRDRVMRKLRAGGTEIVVATDVAARGLDIEQLTHVVNFDVPSAPESYVHRVGRVGRAGREGVAITLAEPREHRQMKNIERAARRKPIPTVADLRLRRLEALTARLREQLQSGGLDEYRAVAENLAGEFDVLDVVAAAVRMADQRGDGAQEEVPEIPAPRPRREKRGPAEGVSRVFIGLGREVGIRPQDLVGAIANEAGLDGSDIGAIEIAERFSLVEVPSPAVDHVIQTLRNTTIKGRRPTVKRDRRAP
jgi:ATP-dependent RNA helicase DeaD